MISLTNTLVIFLILYNSATAQTHLSLTAGGIGRVELAGLLVDITDVGGQSNKIDMVLNEYTTDRNTRQSVLVGQSICRYVIPLYPKRADEDSVRMLSNYPM